MQMIAKFPSKCAKTGEKIHRGDTIEFDPVTKRVELVERKPESKSVNRYQRTDYYIAKYGSGAPA